jgi:hypothetical protein
MISELQQIELSEDGKHYLYNGEDFMRVTDVIGKVMPPYLVPWSEKVGQTAMHEVMSRNPGLSLEEAKQEIREAGLTTEDEKRAGGDRGSALHLAIESMVRTGDILSVSDFDNPEHVKYAQSFAQFVLDYRPEFEEAEVRIVHPELGYAGTFDCIATCRARPKGARGPDITGKRLILDWKTNVSKSVYPSHLYQCAAYELAAQYWNLGVEGSAVVAIGPMGDIKGKPYTFRSSYIEPQAFEQIVKTYNLLEEQKARNPLGRKK